MCFRIITKVQCWSHVTVNERGKILIIYFFFFLLFDLNKNTLHLRKISACFLICSYFNLLLMQLFQCESKNPITTAVVMARLFPIFPCVLEDLNCPRQTGKTLYSILLCYINYLYQLCFQRIPMLSDLQPARGVR